MPEWEVNLAWTNTGVYEVEAENEDDAIAKAITRARREDDAPDEVSVEGVGEIAA